MEISNINKKVLIKAIKKTQKVLRLPSFLDAQEVFLNSLENNPHTDYATPENIKFLRRFLNDIEELKKEKERARKQRSRKKTPRVD